MSAITFAAVTVYLVMLWRYKINWLGPFLMVAVVIALGVATIWLYDDPGPLRPALHSYWIAIHVTAAAISVRAVQLTEQFAEQVVYVAARHAILQQLAIARAHLLPIHPVHAWVVKEIALDAPRVIEDLAPFRRRIDLCFDAAQGERFVDPLAAPQQAVHIYRWLPQRFVNSWRGRGDAR